MSEKAFECGLIVGRFQVIHRGHEEMIRTAIRVCDEVLVFVGSSQESGTEKNPFSYEEREKMLKQLFGDAVRIAPLPDIGVGNNPAWGAYVAEKVREAIGRDADVLISGKEEQRTAWFTGNIAELYVPKAIDISASRMREMLIKGEREAWEAYAPARLHGMFDEMRESVIAARGNTVTQSL